MIFGATGVPTTKDIAGLRLNETIGGGILRAVTNNPTTERRAGGKAKHRGNSHKHDINKSTL